MSILDRENKDIKWEGIYGLIKYLGGLELRRIRKLVCNKREILFLIFLERFQY